MRYISVVFFSLAPNNPGFYPLAGPLFTITYIFLMITGGLNICHKIPQYFLELPPSEPQWLQTLLRVCDWDFVWDATRGKSRAASSDDMEGQDEIEINKMDIIGDEGQGDVQNNDGTLGTYILRNLYLSGQCLLHHLFLLSIFFIFFLYFKKNDFLLKIFIILIALCCRLDSRFSIYCIKGTKCGAAWATLDGVLSKLWVTDTQKILNLCWW